MRPPWRPSPPRARGTVLYSIRTRAGAEISAGRGRRPRPDRIPPHAGRVALKIGLLGFSKVGKTTLFNILTGAHVAVEKYASGKAEPNVGVAKVPEPRLDRLSSMFKPKKTTHAHVDFLDIVGLQKGEAKSIDLKEMRNVDAIAHVVRA